MGIIHFVTTGATFQISIKPEESILEGLRRNNIPVHGILLLNERKEFISMTEVMVGKQEIWAYSLRNIDFRTILPEFEFVPADVPVTELIRPAQRLGELALIQYSRSEALEFIYYSADKVLSDYLNSSIDISKQVMLLVTLSAGGDGRMLAEVLKKYRDNHPNVRFHCLIVGAGFENENEQVINAIKIAVDFDLPYTAFRSHDAAKRLKLSLSFNEITEKYKIDYPNDASEVMPTYLLQQLSFSLATELNCRGIIFGYNQEDVIAERLYQLITGNNLETYPIRRLKEFDIISPLYKVPKRMIDSMDINNSIRNYGQRIPCRSYIRLTLFLFAYQITEQFPALAELLSDSIIEYKDEDNILRWLRAL